MPQVQSPSPRKLSRLLSAAAAIVALIALACFWSLQPSAAPDVTFTSLTGKKMALRDLHGKVVLVNFWATSCAFCMHEMPEMVETYRQFKDRGLELIAVSMSYDPPSSVLDYAQSRKLPFTVALDWQGDLAQAFGNVQATPTTFLIGKDGNIVKRYQGEPEFPALRKLLDRVLASP